MSITISCIRKSSLPVRILRQFIQDWSHKSALRNSDAIGSPGSHLCDRDPHAVDNPPVVFASRYLPVLMVEDGELKNKPVYNCKRKSEGQDGGNSGKNSNNEPCKKRVCSSKGGKPDKKPKKKEEKPCEEKDTDKCVQMTDEKEESHCEEKSKDHCFQMSDEKKNRESHCEEKSKDYCETVKVENHCEEKSKNHCVQMTDEKEKVESHCEEKSKDHCLQMTDEKENRESHCKEKSKDHCLQMTEDCENKSKDMCVSESEKCDRASEDKCCNQTEDCSESESNKCPEPEVAPRSNICIRESAAPIQFIRDFLLGRAYTNALRAPDVMTPRTQPPPCLPLGPNCKYGDLIS